MDIVRLNINVRGSASSGFSGSDEIFEKLALRLGCKLPDEYIEFIRIADGGHPEIGCFPISGDISNNFFEINWFYSFGDSRIESVASALDRWGDILGSKMLPIGKDGGGNQIYINMNDTPETVWIYLHDEGGARIKIAGSFEEFISGLMLNPDLI